MGRGATVVVSGTGEALVAALDEQKALAIPHRVDALDRRGEWVALLDTVGDQLTLLHLGTGTAMTLALAGVSPREVRVRESDVLVRGERVLLAIAADGPPRVLYDGRVDPGLPSPAYAMTVLGGAAAGGHATDMNVDVEGVAAEDGTGRVTAPAGISIERASRNAAGEVLLLGRDARLDGFALVVRGGRVAARARAAGAAWVEVAGRDVLAVVVDGRLATLDPSTATLAPCTARLQPFPAWPRCEIVLPDPSSPPVESSDAPLVAFLERFPDHPRAASLWGEVGRRRRDEGRTGAAAEAFREAERRTLDPRMRDGSLDFELPDLYQQHGDHQSALIALERLVGRLEPLGSDEALFEARMRRAEILATRVGRPQDAVPAYEHLIEDYPRFFPDDASGMRRDKARLFLGIALEKSGRPAAALVQYDTIVSTSVTGTFTRYASERAARLRR